MTKNSTSTIIVRLGGTVAFILLAHITARLAWQAQAFGLNTEGYGYFGWYSTNSEAFKPSSFFEYTDQFWPILGTHFIGLVVTAILFGLLWWIFIQPRENQSYDTANEYSDYVACKDARCPCIVHRQEVFIEGEWRSQDCMDKECPCKENHVDQVFTDGKWVYA